MLNSFHAHMLAIVGERKQLICIAVADNNFQFLFLTFYRNSYWTWFVAMIHRIFILLLAGTELWAITAKQIVLSHIYAISMLKSVSNYFFCLNFISLNFPISIAYIFYFNAFVITPNKHMAFWSAKHILMQFSSEHFLFKEFPIHDHSFKHKMISDDNI